MLVTPGRAAALMPLAFDSKAMKRPLAETAMPGPESPSVGAPPAAPRLTSITSPTAACATSGTSRTSDTSSAAATAARPAGPPARLPLMLSWVPVGAARAPRLAARLRHADTDPPAPERDRRVLRAGARGVDHVHEEPAPPPAQRVAGRMHRVVGSPFPLQVLDHGALRLRRGEARRARGRRGDGEGSGQHQCGERRHSP